MAKLSHGVPVPKRFPTLVDPSPRHRFSSSRCTANCQQPPASQALIAVPKLTAEGCKERPAKGCLGMAWHGLSVIKRYADMRHGNH
jgi:hypothetical protein